MFRTLGPPSIRPLLQKPGRDRHEVTSAWSVTNTTIGSPSKVSIVFTYSRHNTACRLRPALRQKKIAERGTPSDSVFAEARQEGRFSHLSTREKLWQAACLYPVRPGAHQLLMIFRPITPPRFAG